MTPFTPTWLAREALRIFINEGGLPLLRGGPIAVVAQDGSWHGTAVSPKFGLHERMTTRVVIRLHRDILTWPYVIAHDQLRAKVWAALEPPPFIGFGHEDED